MPPPAPPAPLPSISERSWTNGLTCTPELAQAKATDLTNKIAEMATTAPEKVAAIAPKLQEIASQMAAGGDDLEAACKALDEMSAELDK